MPLVNNERWKLTATALNGVAIGVMVAGFIAPIIAVSYDVSTTPTSGYFVAIGTVWFSTAIALHIVARALLGRLKE